MANIFENRVPAVYVRVEDYSYVLPAENGNRSVFGVIVSDRGPHNQVVRVTSVPHFIRLFGKPNNTKHSLMHYQIEKALQYTSYVYVIRASLIDSEIESENASIANTAIKYNSPDGSEEQIFGKFVFTNLNDTINTFGTGVPSNYVLVDNIAWEQFQVGDYIYSGNDDRSKALKIIERDEIFDGTGKYYLKLSNNYEGTSDVDQDNANLLLMSFVNTLGDNDYENIKNYTCDLNNGYVQSYSYEFFPGVESINSSLYNFTNNSNIVICVDEHSYDTINEEQWIYPILETAASSKQVIRKQINEINGDFELVLNDVYLGTTVSNSPAKQYIPFELISQINVRESANLDQIDTDNLWYFKAKGTGSYYNRIFIRGIRNIEYEKLYQTGSNDTSGSVDITEEDPDNIYKYAFMDITINQMNEDGTYTILEGPWTVSMLNSVRRGTGQGQEEEVVIDPYDGRQLYMPFVINTYSEFLECIEAKGTDVIGDSSEAAEIRRLQILSLFSEGEVYGLNVRGKEGFFLQNGEDGILYNDNHRINIINGRIKGTVLRAYNGTLPSADTEKSIQKIMQEIYPKYTFDYVLSGGYDAVTQKAASDLCWMRGSMLLLADTGGYKANAQEDLNARYNDVGWNNWCAALYVQYREIFDPYTGKKIWMTPVYHAIERHLRTDRDYWVSEPVAGIEKGIIEEPIRIAYDPTLSEIGDLIEKGMNPTILDGDAKYFIEQLTTWKRFSKLRDQYVVKFVHYLKKRIPDLLKDILFRKATKYWINQAYNRINELMAQYNNPSDERKYSIDSYRIDLYFDKNQDVLYVTIILQPVGVIKRINVTLKVGNPNA